MIFNAYLKYNEDEVVCVCLENDRCTVFNTDECEKCFIKIIPYSKNDVLSDNVKVVKSSIDKLGKKIDKEVNKINKVNKKFLK